MRKAAFTETSPQQLRGYLAANVKARRRELGLAQEKLALESGVDRTMVSKIERGLSSPGIETLLRLANRLELQPGDLLRPRAPEPFGAAVKPGRKPAQ